MPPTNRFRFKSLDAVGQADAAEDQQFLSHCFVDVGNLEALLDCSGSRRIIVGRTGVGKTALLKRIEDTQERVISIPPENLALAHISNSTILSFLSQLGIRLDVFYKLLWRHVFVVELIKAHYKITDESHNRNFFDNFKNLFRDNKHQQAMEYLKQWGSDFWIETDYRIKEIVVKLENEVKASIGPSLPVGSMNIEGARRMSEEQKREVTERVQGVVNKVQIRQLTDVMHVLNEVLNDPQQRYYIIVDKLDENWIEDKTRYMLIRALIETVRDFRIVEQAKIIIALRRDLIDHVFHVTRDTGFQEEKYEDLYLDLKWSKAQLTEVLDRRINHLVKQRYTNQVVTHQDLLPKSIDKQAPIEYMLERTLMRPRDIIAFFNTCIIRAVDDPQITGKVLKDAENDYSKKRLNALADEWQTDYPHLLFFTNNILRGRPSTFPLQELREQISELCINFACSHCDNDPSLCQHLDEMSKAAHQIVHENGNETQLVGAIVEAFYRIGLIGLKLSTHDPTAWSIINHRNVSLLDTTPTTPVTVHKCFWRALHIKPS